MAEAQPLIITLYVMPWDITIEEELSQYSLITIGCTTITELPKCTNEGGVFTVVGV